MAEPTQPATAANSPTGYAWCSWHKNFSDGTRLVQLSDQGSAFGARGLFACEPCREAYRLVPVADQPMPGVEVDAT
ncbi:hypothetical protein [Streptomyces sp. NPDC058614]|uniref:hypothetical protein n=1 Tax=Streptomyces sp. NPDC058614 TaxID=3346557 RepID=UPI00366902BD